MTGPGPAAERSRLSRRFLRALAIGAGTAAAICVVVVAATLIRQRPVPGLTVLLILAIPLLIVGQLSAIVSIVARQGSSWGRGVRRWRPFVDPRRFFFGDLRGDVATGLVLLAFGGWLAAMTAFPALARGGPDGGDAACPYRLTQHAVSTCVSRAEYGRAGAAEQRLAAGVLLFFFSVHTGAALSGVLRPRQGIGAV
jgi:hypothetical protein